MSAIEDERLARAALSRVGEPGHPALAAAIAQLGPVRALDHLRAADVPLSISAASMDQLEGDLARRITDVRPERDLERAAALGIRFVIPGDEEWPVGIDDLRYDLTIQERGCPPPGLWVKGPLRLSEIPRPVALVGSRSSTTYGAEICADIAATLARAGSAVVSGAAFGIDLAAHRGAVAAGGPTMAILACGVDRHYPAAHSDLLEYLAKVGAVVSELPPGCSPTRLRFLARNRLIAAMTIGTVVVEAALRSGAKNTANWAAELQRHLMAVPGPVTSATSQGTHEMIREGRAVLVTGGADVLEVIGAPGEHLIEMRRGPVRRRDSLTLRQQQVLDGVPKVAPADAISIADASGVGLLDVTRELSRLADRGLVVEEPRGWRLTR